MATENFTSQGYGTKTVDLRAAELGGEYRRGALKVDSELGYQDGNGPTLRKLQSCPPVLDLCFGAYGETSEGVKRLLDNLAESRVRGLGLRKGSLESAKELAQVTGHFRRRLSSAVMQVNVKYLLERILLVGEGQRQAGKKETVGKGGGRKGKVGEGGAVAYQSDRQGPFQEERIPLNIVYQFSIYMYISSAHLIKFLSVSDRLPLKTHYGRFRFVSFCEHFCVTF